MYQNTGPKAPKTPKKRAAGDATAEPGPGDSTPTKKKSRVQAPVNAKTPTKAAKKSQDNIAKNHLPLFLPRDGPKAVAGMKYVGMSAENGSGNAANAAQSAGHTPEVFGYPDISREDARGKSPRAQPMSLPTARLRGH